MSASIDKICPAPGCEHNRKRQPKAEFRNAKASATRQICNTCRASALADGSYGLTCIQCGGMVEQHSHDRACCLRCLHLLAQTSGVTWLIVGVPTSDGAYMKGRFFGDEDFRDALKSSIFETGTVVERWNERVYDTTYRVFGKQATQVDDSPQTLVCIQAKPHGDGRILLP